MDEPLRQPCSECAEPVALDARLCPHCFSSALVDVRLRERVTDSRRRHAAARALQALGPEAPAYSVIQAALGSPEPFAARGVTRAFGHTALATLADHGMQASLERPRPAKARMDVLPWIKVGAAGLVAAAALGIGWAAVLRGRPSPGPAAAEKPALTAVAVRSAGPTFSSRDLAQRSLPSTVSLRCPNSVGSGFFVAPDLVLTNAHVLCPASGTIDVVLSDDRRLTGTVLRSDTRVDLGLVQVAGAGATPLPLGDVADLAVGDKVMMIGSPVGLEFTVHEGNVSSLSRSVEGMAYVQLDAKVNPGNSGGPLIDDRGRVVGIVSLKHAGAEGIGLALPINYAYSDSLHLVGAPDPGAASSSAFQLMVSRARNAEPEQTGRIEAGAPGRPLPVLDGRPLLVGAAVDQYKRLVVRVLRVSAGPPPFEEVALNVWSDTDNFCTLKGDVANWKSVEPQQAGTGVDAQVLRLVQQHAEGRYLYVGESPLRWDLCDTSRMRAGIELELAGAHPAASRIQLR
jgi:S1-C subfamily serine protease